MNKEIFEFIVEKEYNKHSRRFVRVKESCPVATIYVERDFADGCARLFVTITKER